MSNQFSLPPSIMDILVGTELAKDSSQYRCPQCYSKGHIVFFSEVVTEIDPCCFRLTCNQHIPPRHKFVCTEHNVLFAHRKSLIRHQNTNSCKRTRAAFEESLLDEDVVLDEYSFADIPAVPTNITPTTVFENLPSFLSFLPPTGVAKHFNG